MLNQTLNRELSQHRIGEKLRALRLRKKMALVELGQHTGLSPAMLSKIERGRLVPTLPTLVRIALVYSVGLEHFFTPGPGKTLVIVRHQERQRFPDRMDAPDPSYHFESLDFPAVDRKMSAYYVEFEPVDAARVRPHRHGGAEFLYVIRGRLAVIVDSVEHVLEAGDSMYFDPTVLHSYRRAGSRRCSAIVVVMSA
jgi:transcriptional regulator with XRE-family HTH domain